ncbi:hypothetical protein DFA_10918 [Cavenderia fasciculata]|uniref:Pesticidal crystal protein domain-containing protein n=1 Tax=Cavenderia fasciculata TaxID=261658 RepID=F4QBS2_CACFS|nr:uncharacterized protein DFA_10918 [Cavenderia fasciculata]EGG14660.1 hypothetical protein DFA_10918 [Cavenderia fasciculata]|eukprot:XP_004351168.1 hypothetical protein DFA_10918 [Cavenderia fasciculata]
MVSKKLFSILIIGLILNSYLIAINAQINSGPTEVVTPLSTNMKNSIETRDDIIARIKDPLRRRQAVGDVLTTLVANEAEPIIDLIQNHHLDLVSTARGLLVGALSFVPVVGGLLSYATDIAFTLLRHDDTTKKMMDALNEPIKAMINTGITNYNFIALKSKFEGLSDAVKDFRDAVANYKIAPTPDNKVHVHEQFIATRTLFHGALPDFRNQEYKVSEGPISVFACTAFLYLLSDAIQNHEYYGFDTTWRDTFYSDFINTRKSFQDFFVGFYDAAFAQISIPSGTNSLKEYNMRNEFYNAMVTNIFDVSNFWFAMDPILFPNGVVTENTRYLFSSVSGYPTEQINPVPPKKDPHLDTYAKIKARFDSFNYHPYQGRLVGANIWCFDRIDSVQNKFYAYGNPTASTRLGIRVGGSGGALKTLDLSNRNDTSFTIGHDPDNIWKLNDPSQTFGTDRNFLTYTTVSMPGHIVGQLCPLGWNHDQTIQSMSGISVGFVDQDVRDENIIFQETASMITAEKTFAHSPTSITVTKDGINTAMHAINLPANTPVTLDYYLQYAVTKPTLSSNFRIFVYGKSTTTGATTLTFTLNGSVVGSKTFSSAANDLVHAKVVDTGIIMTLSPSNFNNFRIAFNGANYLLQSFILRNEN